MTSTTRFAVSAAILMIAFVVPSLHASNLYVGTCGSPNKATIQQAVTAASPNDTVLVCPGTYAEQVSITKNLTVTGLAVGTADQVIITSPAGGVVRNTYDLYQYGSYPVAAQVLVQNAQQVTLNNIVVDGSGNGISGCALDLRGIYYQNASGTIENVATRNQVLGAGLTGCQSGQGIFVQSGYGSSTPQFVSVLNNSVHSFQKNGITVDGSPLTFLVQKNYVAGQGSTNGAAENGVQISDGATGSVLYNTTVDEIWAPDTSADTGDAASGILVYSSQNVEVGFNTVGSTQFGIASITDPTYPSPQDPQGVGDHTNVHDNQILGTQIFDAIDLCSNNNTVVNNSIFSSTESAVHLDSACGSTGNNNLVGTNVINDACAGVLQGGSSNTIGGAGVLGGLLGGLLGGITLGSNTYFNVASTVLSGNSCPAAHATNTFAVNALLQAATGTGTSHPTPVR